MSGSRHAQFLGTQAVPSARPGLLWLLLAHVVHILAPRPFLHFPSPITYPFPSPLTTPLPFPSSLLFPFPAISPPAAMCQIFVAPQARPHSGPASDFAFASLCYFFRILFAVFLLPTCLSFSCAAHLHKPRSCRRPSRP